MDRVDLAIGGLPVRSRFNSLGDLSDSKNMSARSSKFNASDEAEDGEGEVVVVVVAEVQQIIK